MERSGKTFFETAGLMGTLKTLSRSFLGPRPPLHGVRYAALTRALVGGAPTVAIHCTTTTLVWKGSCGPWSAGLALVQK